MWTDGNRNRYSDVKCECCGMPWKPLTYVDEKTGKMVVEPGHTTDETVAICARYHPDRLEIAKARDELVRTKTTEWFRGHAADWLRVLRGKGRREVAAIALANGKAHGG